jgi:hypothetical protein
LGLRSFFPGFARLLLVAWTLTFPPPAAISAPGDADYDEIALSEVPEPSGITFHPQRGTFFVVGDEGHVAEIDLDGRVKRIRRLGGDLEGVTCDPNTGALYVVHEGEDAILEIRPADLALVRRIPIDRAYRGDTDFLRPSGDGVEGITMRPAADGAPAAAFVVNQFDPPMLVELSGVGAPAIERASIRNAWPVGSPPLSDVVWDPPTGAFLVVSALWRRASVVSAQGEVLRTVTLPGIMQEGLARLPDGSFLITQDTGGLIRWRPASDPFAPSANAGDEAKSAARAQTSKD